MGNTLHSWFAIAAMATMVSACGRAEAGGARYSHEQCRRVALIGVDGAPIIGAEDLALDADNDRLFVSAYDRRATERAAKRKTGAPPNGGVYALPLEKLFDRRAEEANVSSLAAPADFAGGLRPHGLYYDAANKELVFINRTYARDGRKWRMTPQLQRIGANGEMFIGEAKTAPCAANDIVNHDGQILTSFDHASCGFGGGLEDIFRLKRSGYANEHGVVFDKAAFANGIAKLGNGDVVLAATRENALLVVNAENGDVRRRIKLPGGPDNLTLAADGGIVAATHPKMLKLAFNRKLGWGRAPSRIVKADTETGEVEVLFDDPEGALFSAATAAIQTESGLVAGSVTDEGLLVCRDEDGAARP